MAASPTLDDVRAIVEKHKLPASEAPNLMPIRAVISAELLTPIGAYMRLAAHSKKSFLLETATTSGTVGRYSYIGVNPRTTLVTGSGFGDAVDPLCPLAKELAQYRVADVPSLNLPPFTGGAIGYVGYDCVSYFEPKTKRDMEDKLGVPESLFMLFDSIVVLDNFLQDVQAITYMPIPVLNSANENTTLAEAYNGACATNAQLLNLLRSDKVSFPDQEPIVLGHEFTSNIGREGYEAHVTTLKKHILAGDIIQAVPSQRVARPTSLHPFNIYRRLRKVNPSPYLFYLDCDEFQIIGASPEALVKKDHYTERIITHPIAGTIRRGKTPEEDEKLANQLRASTKDQAEHMMLVDLARNDINRVCEPLCTRVDSLMAVQKFSHVQHLVSEVSGLLRPGKTRFDAFRSVFPAGTVSGAPKVRAIELIAEREREKRGVYAGSVGYFGYDSVCQNGERKEGPMDTCIALRTMVTKEGVAYLQAGGGIVFDSDESEEYEETINKLAANVRCIEEAENHYWEEQNATVIA